MEKLDIFPLRKRSLCSYIVLSTGRPQLSRSPCFRVKHQPTKTLLLFFIFQILTGSVG